MANPNVLVILTDDQGWGDLSIHGNTNLDTPNVDSIAQDGVLFNRFYVCPVCAPTRAEFLTGRYHLRGQVHGVTEGAERLCLSEKTIADTFKAAGYSTGAFGKWHNGTQHPYHPNARGFDEFFGFTHEGHFFVPPPYRGVTTWLRRKTLPDGGKGRWTSANGKLIVFKKFPSITTTTKKSSVDSVRL